MSRPLPLKATVLCAKQRFQRPPPALVSWQGRYLVGGEGEGKGSFWEDWGRAGGEGGRGKALQHRHVPSLTPSFPNCPVPFLSLDTPQQNGGYKSGEILR